MKTFRKQPRDHLDYDLDLSDWLPPGDEVQAVEVTAPAGIEITQTGFDADRVKFWIKGGTSGQSYKFSALIYTDSREKEVDFLIVVVDM
ncbi:hypothetical protein [Vreelandella massiliensis]|uniref:phage fiber-tail adaptor protein n=1 Tax=Vreelandella massiliensis TaxID=1816686 RepID=UPI00096A3AE4|nr:hypothetical protein [Halomonas massiliensis]